MSHTPRHLAVRRRPLALAIIACAVPVLMVSLDNLVVTTALTAIREDLGSATSATTLQWVVNAYLLGFASSLLAGAALGDRLGRRRVYLLGLLAFVAGSAACAMSTSLTALISTRAIQGVAAGFVLPLSLTLLSDAVPERMRALAVGIWSGVSGLGIAMGPLVGGLIIEGVSWHWIFWINVPIGLVATPLVLMALRETTGEQRPLDLPGILLSSSSVVALVWGIVHGEPDGWLSRPVLTALGLSVVGTAAFVLRQRMAAVPMLPLSFYRSRSFVGTNLVSVAMNFGVFGSIFLLAQYLQFAQSHTALQAGVRTLAWTLMPMVSAPLAGLFVRRVGGGQIMSAGLFLQAAGLSWLAVVAEPDTPFLGLAGGMVLGGLGMGLVFSAASAVVLDAVRPHDRGRASGANSTVREIGGALGTAVLASVFATAGGSYASPQAFVDGMRPAVWVGVGVVLAGALVALAIPRHAEVADEPRTDRSTTPDARRQLSLEGV